MIPLVITWFKILNIWCFDNNLILNSSSKLSFIYLKDQNKGFEGWKFCMKGSSWGHNVFKNVKVGRSLVGNNDLGYILGNSFVIDFLTYFNDFD